MVSALDAGCSPTKPPSSPSGPPADALVVVPNVIGAPLLAAIAVLERNDLQPFFAGPRPVNLERVGW
jgi:hypothetical protein